MIRYRYNTYRCPECFGVTATRNPEDVVTPMFLLCRATKGCHGRSVSQMYAVPEEWVQPNVRAEFYRDDRGQLSVRAVEPEPCPTGGAA